jgi:hypothetical protein
MTTKEYEEKFKLRFPHLSYLTQLNRFKLFGWFYSNPPPKDFYYLQMNDEPLWSGETHDH